MPLTMPNQASMGVDGTIDDRSVLPEPVQPTGSAIVPAQPAAPGACADATASKIGAAPAGPAPNDQQERGGEHHGKDGGVPPDDLLQCCWRSQGPPPFNQR